MTPWRTLAVLGLLGGISSPFLLRYQLGASCGDGIRGWAEQCDDGNDIDSDDCTNQCRYARCGDGVVAADEACDDGNRIAGDACTNTCTLATCGDGVRGPGEDCDGGPACSPSCTRLYRIGDRVWVDANLNGYQDGAEVGVEGMVVHVSDAGGTERGTTTTNGLGQFQFMVPAGDWSVWLDAADVAAASYDAPSGYVVTRTVVDQPVFDFDIQLATLCGDGIVQGAEQCDDGNTDNADACTSLCTHARCGDGFLQAGEECDDGNDYEDDGCTVGCAAARCGDGYAQPGEQCDGGADCSLTCERLYAIGQFVWVDDNLNGVRDVGEPGVPDLEVTLRDASGTPVDTTTSDADGHYSFHVVAGPWQLSLDDADVAARTLSAPAGLLRSITVDAGGAEANFQLAAFCGDAVQQPEEQCDDGNSTDTDGCTNACTTAACGDGIPGPGEACDDGNADNSDACTNACTTARCGDGHAQPGEACDDGNAIDTDACTNACTIAVCGDGITGPGEACDDGNANNTDACTTSCAAAACGDGYQQAGEACDDGNAINTDACTNACATARCGDGHAQPGEACDDGNAINTDSCTTSCATASCGDGHVQAGEACDDGNVLNTDSCTNACTTATCGDGYVGPGETCDDGNSTDNDSCTNACTPATCGDAIVGPGEQCDGGPDCSPTCRHLYELAGSVWVDADLDGIVDASEAGVPGLVVELYDGADTLTDSTTTGPDGAYLFQVEAGTRRVSLLASEVATQALSAPTGLSAVRSVIASPILDAHIQLARYCGDGIVQTGEQCDDGNAVNTDGCTTTCTTATCGDGIVGPGEACDDGNTSNTDICTNACEVATCGDGFVGPGEACDDANTDNTDDCTNVCTGASCGDGIVGPGEVCDDGNTDNTDACTNACAAATCGDGFLQAGETCDDGNASNTDACTNSCAPAACGDGFVGPGEACDDGNGSNTDACTTTCTAATCGDGYLQSGEGCDDGNGSNTDACTTACTPAACGDGFVQPGEDCDGGDACSDACEPLYALGDLVWRDDDLDGVRDAGEPGLAGIRVRLRDMNSVEQDSTLTDANGHYQFMVPDGPWRLAIATPDLQTYASVLTTAQSVDRTISGQPVLDADFGLAAYCGDGIVQSGEACDDGNTTTTDACTNACTEATCGDGIVGPGEACDGGDACSPQCEPLYEIGDLVYIDENLNGRHDAGEPGVHGMRLRLRTGDNVDVAQTFTDEFGHYSFMVPAGDWKVLAASGDIAALNLSAPNGTFPGRTVVDGPVLTFDIGLGSYCGDGLVQRDEACDDGNTTNGDACSNACTTPSCGDGITQVGEECDDGNGNDVDACSNTCLLPRCGDGIVQQAEQCDDGNTTENDACTNACTTPECGDAIVQAGEQCDDGNNADDDLCTNACTRCAANHADDDRDLDGLADAVDPDPDDPYSQLAWSPAGAERFQEWRTSGAVAITWDSRLIVGTVHRNSDFENTVRMFRPEAVDRNITPLLQNGRVTSGQVEFDVPDPTPNNIHVAVYPDVVPSSAFGANPFRSDVNGNPSTTGAYHTYKLVWLGTMAAPTSGLHHIVMMMNKATVIVSDPHTVHAEVVRAFYTDTSTPLRTESGDYLWRYEPTVSIDGRLIMWNSPASGTNYAFNPDPGTATGWSEALPVTAMYDTHGAGSPNEPMVEGIRFSERYPIAQQPLKDSAGRVFAATDYLPGPYPWLSWDATELFIPVVANFRGAVRSGLCAIGPRTNWQLTHVDGAINPSRSRLATDDDTHYTIGTQGQLLDQSYRKHTIQDGQTLPPPGYDRILMGGIYQTGSMWDPFVDVPYRPLPYATAEETFGFYTSTGRMVEASLPHVADGHYLLAIPMNERIDIDHDLVKSAYDGPQSGAGWRLGNRFAAVHSTTHSQDVSGFNHTVTLQAGAAFPYEYYDAVQRWTDYYNARIADPTLPHTGEGVWGDRIEGVNGNAVFFPGGAAVRTNLNTEATTRLQNAVGTTTALWVKPLQALQGDALISVQSHHWSRISDDGLLLRFGNQSFTIPFDFPRDAWTHIAYRTQGRDYTVFINGDPVQSGTTSSLNVPGFHIAIGPHDTGATSEAIMLIDEVSISDVARTHDEIRALAFRRRDLPAITGADIGLTGPLVDQPVYLADDARTNPETIALGHRLFDELGLSVDSTVSCATCHDETLAFTDGLPVSVGVDGQQHHRSSPTLFNRAYAPTHFLDGRAASLEGQVLQPISDPIEMNLHMANALNRLANSGYGQDYIDAYGTCEISRSTTARALAAYVRTLTSPITPHDEDAVNASARRGRALFAGKARCTTCHNGPNFTDERMRNVGWASGTDNGLAEVTGRAADVGKFKTPTLRGVAHTAPYFHGDTDHATLAEVIDFYDDGGPTQPGVTRDLGIKKLGLTAAEKVDLEAFVRSLSVQ